MMELFNSERFSFLPTVKRSRGHKHFAVLLVVLLVLASQLVVLWFVPSVNANPTTIFSEGFESGNFNAWRSKEDLPPNRTASVQSDVKHHGTYAARFFRNVAGGGGALRIGKDVTAMSEWYFRTYVLFESLAWASGGQARLFGPDNAAVGATGTLLYLYKQSGTYKWRFAYRNAGAWTYVLFTTPAITTGTWYCLEVHVIINAGSGVAEFWIDGTLKGSYTGLNNADRGNAVRFFVGYGFNDGYTPSGDTSLIHDCVVIADTYIGLEPPPEEGVLVQVI